MNTRVKFGSALSPQVGPFSVGVNSTSLATPVVVFAAGKYDTAFWRRTFFHSVSIVSPARRQVESMIQMASSFSRFIERTSPCR